MSNITIFTNPEFGEIRTLTIDDEPWFLGKDIAERLGYSNPRDALAKHVDEEDKNTVAFHDGTSGNPNQTVINESGLYALIFLSKLEGAKKFKRWVTSDVLPAIRKTGGYGVSELEKRKTGILEKETKIHLADQMLRIWDTAGIKPIYQALAMNSYYEELSLPREAFPKDEMALLDLTTIAKDLGIKSESGKPHAQAVGAIIKKLEIDADEYEETPYCRNGHDGVSMQYKPSVETKISQWLDENNYPKTVANGKAVYRIKYAAK